MTQRSFFHINVTSTRNRGRKQSERSGQNYCTEVFPVKHQTFSSIKRQHLMWKNKHFLQTLVSVFPSSIVSKKWITIFNIDFFTNALYQNIPSRSVHSSHSKTITVFPKLLKSYVF